MARSIRSALDAALTRISPVLTAHLKMWRRAAALERESGRGSEWEGWIGVDYREREQLELVRRWDRHAALFEALRRDRNVNLGAPEGPIENPWYATPDAEVYAAMIADRRPSNIVEVGAGFSTRIARRTVTALGLASRITIVDPTPRTDVADVADEVIARRVERVDPDRLPLDERSLLFVDSSHVVLGGGDVPYLYGVVIPSLPAGALVEVHDVFLPFDYPRDVRLRLYGEQYLLHALLSASPRYRVAFATHLMVRRHAAELARVIPGADARDGGSFWFEVGPGPAS